jgi:hypothetical protein
LSLLVVAGCSSAPGAIPEPPTLTVTSPLRSLVQSDASTITVTGTAIPAAEGTAIQTVTVNDVAATVSANGSFTANVQIQPGASFLHTVATDSAGGTASDTRSVHAGELRPVGSNIDNAITAAISANAFAKISGAASTLIAQTDFNPLLAPLQPMQHSGDEDGPDCLYDEAFIDGISFTNSIISLTPVEGGLSFSLEVDGLNVPAHANFAVACVDGSESMTVTADKVLVTGTLLITPDGSNGFATTLDSPNVQLTNFNLDASGIPGEIVDMMDMNSAIGSIISVAAEKFMGPMMNQALGGLAGPKQVNVLGQTVDIAVTPTDLSFDATGGVVALSTSLMIEGAENSPGYIFTDNGSPVEMPGQGLTLGLADDLANEALAEFAALGMLKLSMPTPGGAFDNVNLDMTSPPMISADPTDGKMRLFLGDVKMTFTLQGTPVADAYLNAKVDLAIASVDNGNAVAVQLGTPTINVDVGNDIPNATHLEDADLSTAVQLSLGSQISTITPLLAGIPLPSVAGLQLSNVSVMADDGYVMVQATLN